MEQKMKGCSYILTQIYSVREKMLLISYSIFSCRYQVMRALGCLARMNQTAWITSSVKGNIVFEICKSTIFSFVANSCLQWFVLQQHQVCNDFHKLGCYFAIGLFCHNRCIIITILDSVKSLVLFCLKSFELNIIIATSVLNLVLCEPFGILV